ncbi:alcohol dehydrogenase transcription factor myb/SANT-like domain-containing protein [Phthorimaea operculella]|nr:alcohol dehydrogenase transcription factor myb/SANT-like domain-containing protein [Phthorimaea operculella]
MADLDKPVMTSIVDINIPKLIAGVKKRPALYDTSHMMYREKSRKKKLWQEVFMELCTPAGWNSMTKKDRIDYGYEVTKKWNSLRSCYRREIVYQHRASKGNQSEENNYCSDTNDDSQTQPAEEIILPFIDPMETKEEFSNQTQASNVNNDDDDDYVSFKKYRSIRQAENEQGGNIKKYRSVREDSKNTVPKSVPTKDDTIIEKEYQVKVETVNDEEADVSFLQSLLPAMKELTSDQKLLLRIEIMRTIYKFKQNLRQT